MDYFDYFKQASLLLIIGICSVNCDRTSKKIYHDISGMGACFRRFNSTAQIGCSSGRMGNVGVVHYIESDADVDWLVNKGPHQPYTAFLTPHTFTSDVVLKLRDSKKINGIIVISTNDTDRPEAFSPDNSCPNNRFGMYHDNTDYKDCQAVEWNPVGNNLMFEDFDFPIVAISNNSDVHFITKNCYEMHNKPLADGTVPDYPLCSAEVKDAMDGAKDTPTCMRRSNLVVNLNPEKYCDPMGDENIFVLTKPLNNTETLADDSVIIAATRSDGFSMFEGMYPNVDSPVSGIITLLAAASALQDNLASLTRPIMFTFFQGEAFDYIGSSRMVYDMEKGKFPGEMMEGESGPKSMGLTHINSFLEVSQVGLGGSDLWIHSDPVSQVKPEVKTKVDNMVNIVTGTSSGLNVKRVTADDQPLPPASLQSFLKQRDLIPGIVLADHDTAFTNNYYNSRLDTADQIHLNYKTNETYNETTDASSRLQKVALVVAQSLYKMSTGQTAPDSIVVDEILVANLLYCFTQSPRCELFNQTLSPRNARNLASKPYPFYVGVSGSANYVTQLTLSLMAQFYGTNVTADSEKDCNKKNGPNEVYTYTWMNGKLNASGEREHVCIRSTANSTIARSPAFDEDGYEWSSEKYSAWTESRWQNDAMSVRVFLRPSPSREIGTLCGGLAMFLVSMVIVYFLDKRSSLLFTRPASDC